MRFFHDRVADLARFRRGADHGHRIRLHDAAHRGQDLVLPGAETRLGGFLQQYPRIHCRGASGAGENRVQVEFVDFRAVADQPADVHDQGGQRLPVDARGAAHPVQHRRARDVVQHGSGFVFRRRRQPEGQVAHDFDEHAPQPESDELAEYRIGHGADDHLLRTGVAAGLTLHEHAVDGSAGRMVCSDRDQAVVGGCKRALAIDAQDHAAHIGLVQDVGRVDLGDHRIADAPGDRAGRRR